MQQASFLVLSDIHGHSEQVRAAILNHPHVEAVLVAGDISNFGTPKDVDRMRDALCADGISRRIFAVPGNCDPADVRRHMKQNALSVEDTRIELPEATILGTGGGLRRAGLTSYERTEWELAGSLEPLLAGYSSTERKHRIKPLIVLTHSPPYGTNADRRGEQHVGSHELARLMLEHAPDVWICGHIHESPCVSLEDGTLVINPGTNASGQAAMLLIQFRPAGGYELAARLFRLR